MRRVVAAVAALVVAAAGVVLPQTAAFAVPVGQIVVASVGPTVRAMPAPFEFNVSWSCSGQQSERCDNLRIAVPITLDNPVGAIEDMDLWQTTVHLPSPSAAGFAYAWTRSGSQLLLELTASQPIAAGTSENIGVVIQPHPATGDGVGFTFGHAQLSSDSFATVTSAAAIDATVTAQRLQEVEKQLISLRPDAAGTVRAIYRIWPRIRQAWNPATETWGACSTNVSNSNQWDTAVAGTVLLIDQLPAQGTFVSATGGGSYDAGTHSVIWDDCAQMTANLLVEVSYPAATGVADPAYIANLTNTVTRTFTDTAGVVRTSSDDATHANIGIPRTVPNIYKCGTSSMIPDPSIVLTTGLCSPPRVSPTYPFSGDRNDHHYMIRLERLIEGDEPTVTDWMPCFTNPLPGAVETYGSAAGCADPTNVIVGLGFAQGTPTGAVSILGYRELTLYLQDGSSLTFDPANPIASLNPLPAFGGGAVVGFRAVLDPIAADHVTGTVGVYGKVTPGVDRDMVLENDAAIRIENPLTGDLYTRDHTIGRIRVVDGPFGATGATGGISGGRPYIRGNFGAANLDPADGLPTYTLVLPSGYEVAPRAGGDPDMTIMGLGAPDNANPALGDPANYDIDVVPEDLATGTPGLIRVTPRPGTPAVPTAVDGRWPQILITAFVRPTWGVVSGIVPIASYTSVDAGASGPHIRGCIWHNSWFAPQQFLRGDVSDYDGDGETGTDTGCISTGNADFITTNVASSLLFKMARAGGSADPWSSAGGTVTSRTGQVEYQIRWENAGRPTLQDIVLYDVFPHVGDTGMLAGNSGDPRGSEFAPTFQGITSQSSTSNAVIQYSASSNPCRPEIYVGQGSCVNDWTAAVSDLGGAAQVRAMRIVLSGQWTGGSSFTLRYTMQAPAGTPAGHAAWNSVAGTAHLPGGGSLASAESGSVGFRMPAEVEVAKSSPQVAAPVGVGSTIEYLITATNSLTSRANDVEVVDDLSRMLLVADYNDDAVATIDGSPVGGVTYEPSTGRLRWTGDLGDGETVQIRFTMTATAATTAAGGTNGVAAFVDGDPTNCEQGTEPGCSVVIRIVEPGLELVKSAVGLAEGVTLSANALVSWRYTVTNTGSEPLEALAVTDDQGVAVSCPVTRLAIGASTVCTGSGSIGAGPRYENVGTAVAVGESSGGPVSDSDPWFALVAPTISIDKYATEVAEGSTILAGTDVTWSYEVRNTSTEPFEQLVVTDTRGVAVTCPRTALNSGESMVCTGTGNVGTATPYSNTGVVAGRGEVTGIAVTASDPWSVRLVMPVPNVRIVKDSAAVTEGSTVDAETVVTWRYAVTNTGEELLRLVTVTDDRGVAVACPQDTLAVGATMTCTGSGSVGFGPSYTNIGTVNAVGGTSAIPITADDPWTVNVTPYSTGITIDKVAPAVAEGSRVRPSTVVSWEYIVTNAGQEPIGGIAVTDDRGVAVTCPATELDAGESMTCTGSGSVGAGPEYRNVGTVTGTTTLTSTPVSDDDPWQVEVREPVASIGLVKGALNAVRGDRVPANFVVDWRYAVVNTGEESIESLSVIDDQGVVVVCPVTRLEAGETVVCAGAGSIGTGSTYTNVATATGRGELTGAPVSAEDDWTVGVDIPPAAIRIIKDAVGHSVGEPVRAGAVITWTYTVVNTGGQPITDLLVVDDRGVPVVCPENGLEIGDSMVCTGSGGVGSAASYTNIGSVTGTPLWAGPPVVDEDPWTTPITPAPTSTPGSTPSGPPSGLPVTGAGTLAPFAAASTLLLLTGTALLLRSRRRNHRRAGGL